MGPRDNEWPDHIRQWVTASVHPFAKVLSVRRLYGGISSIAYRLAAGRR